MSNAGDEAASGSGRPSGESRRRFSELGIRLLLVLFSFGLTALFAEVALRIVLPADPPSATSADTADDGFEFFTYHEELGWDLVPNTSDRHQSSEFDVTIRITPQGLRDEREYELERTPGTRRIVVIGDSFSFGHGVDVERAYPALLEESLKATEIINLSVTGYGTDQQLLRLVNQGLKWQPDFVLLGLFEGNVFRNARDEYLGYPKPRFELKGAELELANVPVPRVAKSTGWIEHLRLWQLAGRRGWDLLEHLGFGSAWPVTEAILARLDQVSTQAGAQFLVVVLPKDQAVYGQGLRRAVHDKTLTQIDAMLARLNIAHLDLTPILVRASHKESLYFLGDGHWTAAAHREAAVAISDWLVENWNFSSL